MIQRYDPSSCRGMICDSSGQLLTFNEKGGNHIKYDRITYDLIHGIVYNVQKVDSNISQPLDSEISKRVKKSTKKDKKSSKIATKCLCILDIQTISLHGNSPQISQIGALIFNDQNQIATFFRTTISPDMATVSEKYLLNCNVDPETSVSEFKALSQFEELLDEHVGDHNVAM